MFSIRPPRADELPILKTLLEGSGLPASDLTEQHLKHFIILGQASRIAGSVGMETFGEDALLRSLAVETMLRGEGYGQRLLELMEMQARDHGVQRLYLLTTSADGFFVHHGYERIDRASVPEAIKNTTQFAGMCPSNANCLYKSLN